MSFKQVKSWKLQWIKNASAEGGAMKQAIEMCSDDKLVIHSHTRKLGRMWTSSTPTDLEKLCMKNRGMYEVLTKYPMKLYFDIDQKGKADGLLAKVKKDIQSAFKGAEMAVSGSVTDEKTSYHIIVNNYIIANIEQRETVKSWCKLQGEPFDWKVYTDNRNMKCVNQSKQDGRVQQLIEDDDITHHFITCFMQKSCKEIPSIPTGLSKEQIDSIKESNKLDLGKLKKILTIPEEFPSHPSSLELLNLAPISPEYDHAYTHTVARFCHSNGVSFADFWQWNKRKCDTVARFNKWVHHWGRLVKFPTVCMDVFMRLMKNFYPDLDRDRSYVKFKDMTNIGYTRRVNRLTNKTFTKAEKYMCVNFPMGAGKTGATIDFLKGQSFCWITPRRSLARNTESRISKSGIKQCLSYLSLKDRTAKASKIPTADKLIIQAESLHYLGSRTYDTIVIDEIETVINSWTSFQTHSENISTNWNVFKNLLQTAKKVIFLDAFTTKRTTNMIKRIDPDEGITVVGLKDIELAKIPERNMHIFDKFDLTAWLNSILTDVKQGKKLFVYYPFRRESKSMPSIEGVKTLFEKYGAKTICYHGENSGTVNKTLANINNEWKALDVVLTNSKITVGVNFDVKHFDACYLLLAPFSSPRDVIQSSYRVRNFSSMATYAMIMPGKNFLFKNETPMLACPDLQATVSDVFMEKLSPLKETFRLFSKLARYSIANIKTIVDKESKKQFKAFFAQNDLTFKYESIDSINYEQMDDVQKKIFNEDATMHEIMSVRKFWFDSKFQLITTTEVRAHLWNSHCEHLITIIADIEAKKNDIPNQIFESMGILDIEDPLAIFSNKKRKPFTDKLKEQILQFVVSPFDHAKSSDEKYMAIFLNSLFGRTVLEHKNPKNSRNGIWTANKTTIESIHMIRTWRKKPTKELMSEYAFQLDANMLYSNDSIQKAVHEITKQESQQ